MLWGLLLNVRVQSGASTVCSTSSMTSSGVTPSSASFTASNSLPHCMLRSFSGAVSTIL